MMNPALWMGLLWVIVLLAVVAWVIRNWGPGASTRSVHCPEKRAWARLVVVYRESDFGSVKAVDVADCSLLDCPVNCGKGCLARL